LGEREHVHTGPLEHRNISNISPAAAFQWRVVSFVAAVALGIMSIGHHFQQFSASAASGTETAATTKSTSPDPVSTASAIPLPTVLDDTVLAAAPHALRVDPLATPAVISLLSNVERLNIRFLAQPSLTGEYSIAGDETLSLPVIGRLDVRGLSLVALEQLLAREVLRLTGRETFVTVDVIDYREVFVTGMVARTGAHRWKRGMTVLHAESLAGGIYRPVGANGSTMVTEGERTRARRAGADLIRLYAQQARLIAEKDGTKLVPPLRLGRIADDREVAAAVAAQETVLQSRLASYEAQQSGLKRIREVASIELASIALQRERLRSALDNRKSVLVSIRNLKKSGIVNNERVLNDEARVLELEERVSSLAVSASRLQAAVIGAERDLDAMTLDRKASIETELQRIDREIAQLEIESDSATQTFRSLTGASPIASSQDDPATDLIIYEVIRNQGNKVRRFLADQTTELVPGDMVIISPRRHIL
jgi:protein involved in polysaccharide export with SLBB domain